MTPRDEIGCKRIMITDDWYPTLTPPNVELVTERIAEITPTGVRTADGRERAADVLVLATGFRAHDFVAPMEITVEAAMGHVIAALRALDRADARRIEIRPEAAAEFDRELRMALARSVWHSGCTTGTSTRTASTRISGRGSGRPTAAARRGSSPRTTS